MFHRVLEQIAEKSLDNLKEDAPFSAQEIFDMISKRVICILANDFFLYEDGMIRFKTTCITSQHGYGNIPGSEKTPLGLHRVHEMIGDGFHQNQKFVHRLPTQIVTPPVFGEYNFGMYGRILRLDGLETENSTTLRRNVYIHGNIHNWYWESPDLKRSRGCIGLKNDEIVMLYDMLKYYKEAVFVYIDEK